jgi:outer membrane receptor protein involved in Fe transport
VFTWSVAPRFEFSDQASLYARVAKGYRPGGPNAVPPNAPPGFPAEFEADTLISYEAGVRVETVDRSVSVDAALFYLDWDNILINTVVFDANGTPFGANGNGQRARSVGFEATTTFRPMRGLTGVWTIAYTDAELRDDTVPEGGGLNLTGGLAGDRLPYTPEISTNLSLDYEWALSPTAMAFVGGNVRLVGDQAAGFTPEYRAAFGRRLTIDGYETIDLRAGVEFDQFSVSAFVRNLTDSRGIVNAGYPTTIPADIGGTNVPLATLTPIRPRTIGITLGARF